MSAGPFTGNPLIAGIEDIRRSWGWALALGILLIVFGAVCIIGDVTATFVTVLTFGWLLLFSGIAALIHAFRTRTWSGLFLYLLSALLRGFTGYLLIRYPSTGAEGLTLILASFFIVGGLFRAIGAEMVRFPRWGWVVVSGIVSLPSASVWFIGFAIGVDLIVDGASLIGFATAIHGLLSLPVYRPA